MLHLFFAWGLKSLKKSIIEHPRDFFTSGWDENGDIISPDYKTKVLSLDKKQRPLSASLKWLHKYDIINQTDVDVFFTLKDQRNLLTHELIKCASEGVDFDIAQSLEDLFKLLKKIEIWFFENVELAVDFESYPDDLDVSTVIPGPVWLISVLIQVAVGNEKSYLEALRAGNITTKR